MYRKLLSYLLIMLTLLMTGSIGRTADQKVAASNEPATERYFIFDTIVSLRVYDERMTSQHFDEVGALLERIDQRMNRHWRARDRSGQSSGGQIRSERIRGNLQGCPNRHRLRAASGGHFEPTIGPLVTYGALAVNTPLCRKRMNWILPCANEL